MAPTFSPPLACSLCCVASGRRWGLGHRLQQGNPPDSLYLGKPILNFTSLSTINAANVAKGPPKSCRHASQSFVSAYIAFFKLRICMRLAFEPVWKGAPSGISICGLTLVLRSNYLLLCWDYFTEKSLKMNISSYAVSYTHLRAHETA